MTNKYREFDKLIDEVIDCFAEERYDQGADGVAEIAHQWKSAGYERENYLELMQYIEEEAARKAEKENDAFFRLRIMDALRRQRSRLIMQVMV